MCALHLTFDYIENLSLDQLKQIQRQQLIQTSIEALQSSTEDILYRVFHFIFNSIVNLVPVKEIDADVLDKALPHLEYLFAQKISSGNKDDYNDVTICAELLLTLLDNINSVINLQNEIISILSIKTIPCISFHVLTQLYSVLKNQKEAENNDQIDAIFHITNDLQKSLMKIVLSDLVEFQSTAEDARYFRKFMLDFLQMAESAVLLDEISITAQFWKCFSKINDNYAAIFIQLTANIFAESEVEGIFDWFNSAVLYLCGQICKGLKEILSEIQMVPDNQASTERNLKLNSFFMKILSKLITGYPANVLRGQKDLIACFILVKGLREELLQGHIKENSSLTSLEDSFVEIFDHVFHDPNFAEEALMSDCVFVYVEVIKRIVGERNASKRVEELYLNKNFENNVAHRMLFNALGKDDLILRDNSIFLAVANSLAALLVRFTGDSALIATLEEILVESILQNDIFIGIVAMEVWHLHLRRCSSEVITHYLKFWIHLNEQFTWYTIQPMHVFIKLLIRKIFHEMSSPDKIKAIQELSTDHVSTITTIGLKEILDVNESKGNQICGQMAGKIQEILDKFEEYPNYESYNQLCEHLICLSTSLKPLLTDNNQKILKQVSNIAAQLTQITTSKCVLLVQAMMKFLLHIEIPAIDDDTNKYFSYSNIIKSIASNKQYKQITQLEFLNAARKCMLQENPNKNTQNILFTWLLHIYGVSGELDDETMQTLKDIALAEFSRNEKIRAILEANNNFQSATERANFSQNSEKIELGDDTFMERNNKFNGILSKLNPQNKSDLLALTEALTQKIGDFQNIDGFSSVISDFIRMLCVDHLNVGDLQEFKELINNQL